jgi:uncharacterized protein (DUF849 family)
MGLNFTMPADTETMLYIRNFLFASAQWQGFGIGRNQFSMAMQSMLLGGHVRVGIEDTVYERKGVFWKSNADQATKARRRVKALGPRLASPDEARAARGLAPRRQRSN